MTSLDYAFHFYTGPIAGHTLHVHGPTTLTIGRSKQRLALDIPDDALSRCHALISVVKRGVLITDHNARNGLWKNAKRVHHAWLRHGDHIALGRSRALVQEMPKSEQKRDNGFHLQANGKVAIAGDLKDMPLSEVLAQAAQNEEIGRAHV